MDLRIHILQTILREANKDTPNTDCQHLAHMIQLMLAAQHYLMTRDVSMNILYTLLILLSRHHFRAALTSNNNR